MATGGGIWVAIGEQAQALFAATRTLSYRVFFFTLYSLGLRLSEGLALSVADIDAERARVQVRDSKGILATNRYTHLTTQSEALATQRIDALMSRFNLGWGAVK